MKDKSILFLADSDSQIRPAYLMASRIAEALGWNLVGNIVPSRQRASRRQIMGAKLDCPLTFHDINYVVEKVAPHFAAIVVFLPGSRLHSFRIRLEREVIVQNLARRPILIAGYNGVIYEKHLEGLLWRVGYDVIAINSVKDQERFGQTLASLGCDDADLVRAGVLLAQQGENRIFEHCGNGALDRPVRRVMFACQALTPEPKEERLYLLERLRDYALTHPDRTVYIKPRTLPTEVTFHAEEFHYAELYEERYGGQQLPNLHFAYGAFHSYLKSIDLLVSVSSTAVIEAMVAGVRGALLTDCGIKESLGNHFFIESGLLTTMDRLIADQLPRPRRDWLERNGFGAEDRLDTVVERVRALVDVHAAAEGCVPFRPVFYTSDLAPYIHARLLPRDTVPEPAPAEPPEPPSVPPLQRKARKLVRHPARFFADAWSNQKNRVEKLVRGRASDEAETKG